MLAIEWLFTISMPQKTQYRLRLTESIYYLLKSEFVPINNAKTKVK